MTQEQLKNPLHGQTLQKIIERLVEHYGWQKLGELTNFQCFINNPNLSSSLKFLRKTPWARKKVESLFLQTKFKV